MQRRQFIRLTGGVVVALVAGCGSSLEQVSSSAPPLPSTATGRQSLDRVFEIDPYGARLLELQPLKGVLTAYSLAGDLLFTASDLATPIAAAAHPSGAVYVLDRGRGQVVVYGPTGARLAQLDGQGTFARSLDIAVDREEIFSLDYGNGIVEVLSTQGTPLRTLSLTPEEGHFRALAVDRGRNLRVLMSNPPQVQVISPATGAVLALHPAPEAVTARDLSITPEDGTVLVDHLSHQLLFYDAEGAYLGSQSATNAQGETVQPLRVAADRDGQLYLLITEVVAG